MTESKKPRKKRSDAGKKRGKRIKNPRLQTGSIDFRHIGTSATMGQNLTALAGLVASSRPAFPTFSQDQQLINELRKKEEDVKNNELVIKKQDLIIKQQNIPPQPQFRPDTEQAQEESQEEENVTKVRKAMGNRISRQNKEIEDLEQKSMELKENNLMADEELRQKQYRLIEQEGILTRQKEELIRGSNNLQRPGLVKILKEQGIEVESNDDITDLRVSYLRSQGLKLNEDYKLGTREGARGKASKEFDLIPIPKQDLQQGQEEKPAVTISEFQQAEYEPGGGGGIPVENELKAKPLTVELPVSPKRTAQPSPKLPPPPPPAEPPSAEELEKIKKKSRTVKEYSKEELLELEKRYIKNQDSKKLEMIRKELKRRKEESDFYED